MRKIRQTLKTYNCLGYLALYEIKKSEKEVFASFSLQSASAIQNQNRYEVDN